MANNASAATPNNQTEPWYLLGRLHALMLDDGRILLDDWNDVIWGASNANRTR